MVTAARLQNLFSMNNKLLAALVSLTLIACGNPIVPAGEDLSGSSTAELKARAPAKPPAPAAWTVRVSATSTNPVFATSFAIATTYDLYLAFDIPVALAGQHVAAFEVLSPDGAVYQRTQVSFSSGTSTQYRVWSSMPVAGTWIQQFAMTGAWSVRVFLDAESVSRAAQTFVLQ